MIENLHLWRPDIYWGVCEDFLVAAAAAATCDEERQELLAEAAEAKRLSQERPRR
ncbi:hypothetical protein [Roseomonas fluvialis]|nr:hypothetical protein [Roseomonas fluvialis]